MIVGLMEKIACFPSLADREKAVPVSRENSGWNPQKIPKDQVCLNIKPLNKK